MLTALALVPATQARAAEQTFVQRDIANPPVAAGAVHAVDLDGDGDMDVVAASASIVWYENDGAANPSFTLHTIDITLNDPSSVRAADLDGDGDADVLAASGSDGRIAW